MLGEPRNSEIHRVDQWMMPTPKGSSEWRLAELNRLNRDTSRKCPISLSPNGGCSYSPRVDVAGVIPGRQQMKSWRTFFTTL
jgi:hypothetical protein